MHANMGHKTVPNCGWKLRDHVVSAAHVASTSRRTHHAAKGQPRGKHARNIPRQHDIHGSNNFVEIQVHHDCGSHTLHSRLRGQEIAVYAHDERDGSLQVLQELERQQRNVSARNHGAPQHSQSPHKARTQRRAQMLTTSTPLPSTITHNPNTTVLKQETHTCCQ